MKDRSTEIRLTVPFYDLDPMNIVWHGNYLKYFDRARTALLDHLGVDLHNVYQSDNYIFPITKTTTKHIYPLKHKDEFICKVTLVEVNVKILMNFEIRLAETGQKCCTGKSEQVVVRIPENETLFKVPEKIKKSLGF